MVEESIRTLVEVDQRWVPHKPGTSLYIRPTVIATETFLGVHPSHSYLYYVIVGPVGAYYKEGMNPVRILASDTYVRAVQGGLGAAKTAGNYAASLYGAEEAQKAGYTQVLWLDGVEHKYLDEVGTMNIMLKIGDEVITPPLNGAILAGITRRFRAHPAARLGPARFRTPDRHRRRHRRRPGRHAGDVGHRHRRRDLAGGRTRLQGRALRHQRRPDRRADPEALRHHRRHPVRHRPRSARLGAPAGEPPGRVTPIGADANGTGHRHASIGTRGSRRLVRTTLCQPARQSGSLPTFPARVLPMLGRPHNVASQTRRETPFAPRPHRATGASCPGHPALRLARIQHQTPATPARPT